MESIVKRIFLMVVAIIIFCTACGYTVQMTEPNSATSSVPVVFESASTPEDTITMALDALKRTDTTTFNQLVKYVDRKNGVVHFKDNILFGDNLDGDDFVSSIVNNLTYEIINTIKNDNIASVEVQITNSNLSKVTRDIIKYTDADNALIEAIKNTDEVVINNVTVKLEHNGKAWVILMDKDFANAICGGLSK